MCTSAPAAAFRVLRVAWPCTSTFNGGRRSTVCGSAGAPAPPIGGQCARGPVLARHQARCAVSQAALTEIRLAQTALRRCGHGRVAVALSRHEQVVEESLDLHAACTPIVESSGIRVAKWTRRQP